MYKNILVPVVFDEKHDTQASFLAERALAENGATFTAWHVVEAIPTYAKALIPTKVLAKSRRGGVELKLSKLPTLCRTQKQN
ncbi:MAG: hypothetical protein AAGK71_09030 [Pseudomonadota bacterium]